LRVLFRGDALPTVPLVAARRITTIDAGNHLNIGVAELTRTAQNIAASTYRPLEAYVAAGLIYFVICGALALVAHAAEYRLQHA